MRPPRASCRRGSRSTPTSGSSSIRSAQYGTTDHLLAEAQIIANDPSPLALDLLWSTGELRSVAILALHLQKIGVSAVPFNVHQTGLVASPGGGTSVRPERLRAALLHARASSSSPASSA